MKISFINLCDNENKMLVAGLEGEITIIISNTRYYSKKELQKIKLQ